MLNSIDSINQLKIFLPFLLYRDIVNAYNCDYRSAGDHY